MPHPRRLPRALTSVLGVLLLASTLLDAAQAGEILSGSGESVPTVAASVASPSFGIDTDDDGDDVARHVSHPRVEPIWPGSGIVITEGKARDLFVPVSRISREPVPDRGFGRSPPRRPSDL